MSDVDTQLVREYFELLRYRVVTHWQHDAQLPRVADPGSLLFIERTEAPDRPVPAFNLGAEDTPNLHRAVVEVRAWHTDRFYPSVIENSATIAHAGTEEVRKLAASIFGGQDSTNVLVISELPKTLEQRERTGELLRGRGIEHLLEFPVLMGDLLARLNPNGQYAPSPRLQALRLVKRYHFLRRQQMEFSFPGEAPAPVVPAPISTDIPDDETE